MAQTDKAAKHDASNESLKVMRTVINFLKLFMSETLAKRLLRIILISSGLSNSHVTELTG